MNTNPWCTIPLSDYETHMAHDSVQQTALLADLLERAAAEFRPASLAVIGCSGGNGLDRIDASCRVGAIDINTEYVEAAKLRYEGKFGDAVFQVHDIEEGPVPGGPYDMVSCALVLEYVDLETAATNIVQTTKPGGRIIVVLQGLNADKPMVSQTPITSVNRLDPIMTLLDPSAVESAFSKRNCTLEARETVRSVTEKEFHALVFRRRPVEQG